MNVCALRDFCSSLRKQELWRTLGWYDVLSRYRRSTLGPFWITLSMAVTIAAMEPLYGALFSNTSEDFIPHLALGIIIWGFISTSINDSCHIFNDSSNYLKQTKIEFSIFIFRVIYRQSLIFAHNIIIIPFVFLLTGKAINLNILYVIPGGILLLMFIFGVCLITAIFCTRYRDMVPVIQSVMTLLFFVSPIIWSINQLPESRRYLASFNVFGKYIELVRQPMMGEVPDFAIWLLCILVAIISFLLSLLLLERTYKRIAYWL